MGGPSVAEADEDLTLVVSGDPPAISQKWARDNVKRPAPGGEGRNINPYSRRSLDHYLDYFGKQIEGLKGEGIRAQFHDSFEYDGNWSDDFLTQFEQRRGYRLQDHVPALAGEGDPDEVARVKCDYRETLVGPGARQFDCAVGGVVARSRGCWPEISRMGRRAIGSICMRHATFLRSSTLGDWGTAATSGWCFSLLRRRRMWRGGRWFRQRRQPGSTSIFRRRWRK